MFNFNIFVLKIEGHENDYTSIPRYGADDKILR